MRNLLLAVIAIVPLPPASDSGVVDELPSVASPPDGPPVEQGGDPTINCRYIKDTTGGVEGLAFSPDGKTLAAGNKDGMIVLYSTTTLGEIGGFRVRKPHKGWIYGLAYSPDGKTLVAPPDSNTLARWEIATGRPRLRMDTPAWTKPPTLFALACTSDGATAAAGGLSGEVAIWDATTGRCRFVLPPLIVPERRIEEYGKTIREHAARISALEFNADGTTLAAVAEESPVRLWDPATGREQAPRLPAHDPICLAFSPDGKTLAVSDSIGESLKRRHTITLWDIGTGRARAVLPTAEAVTSLKFLPGGRALVSLEDWKLVGLWDVAKGRRVASYRLERHCRAEPLAISPDGGLIAVGGWSSHAMFGIIDLIRVDGDRLKQWRPGVESIDENPVK